MTTMKPAKGVHPRDAQDRLIMGYNDLVLVHGLERRSDLNNRLAKAHGRVKKGTEDREGVTMLELHAETSEKEKGEELWCRRANLRLVHGVDLLNRACDECGVSDAEREKGLLFLGAAKTVYKAAFAQQQAAAAAAAAAAP